MILLNLSVQELLSFVFAAFIRLTISLADVSHGPGTIIAQVTGWLGKGACNIPVIIKVSRIRQLTFSGGKRPWAKITGSHRDSFNFS